MKLKWTIRDLFWRFICNFCISASEQRGSSSVQCVRILSVFTYLQYMPICRQEQWESYSRIGNSRI